MNYTLKTTDLQTGRFLHFVVNLPGSLMSHSKFKKSVGRTVKPATSSPRPRSNVKIDQMNLNIGSVIDNSVSKMDNASLIQAT
jgi:hypothetical protein